MFHQNHIQIYNNKNEKETINSKVHRKLLLADLNYLINV